MILMLALFFGVQNVRALNQNEKISIYQIHFKSNDLYTFFNVTVCLNLRLTNSRQRSNDFQWFTETYYFKIIRFFKRVLQLLKESNIMILHDSLFMLDLIKKSFTKVSL